MRIELRDRIDYFFVSVLLLVSRAVVIFPEARSSIEFILSQTNGVYLIIDKILVPSSNHSCLCARGELYD